MEELLRRLMGMQDSRGPQGIAARGTNIYPGNSTAAHRGGGPQFGRPPKPAPMGIPQNANPNPGLALGNTMGTPTGANPNISMDAVRRRLQGGRPTR